MAYLNILQDVVKISFDDWHKRKAYVLPSSICDVFIKFNLFNSEGYCIVPNNKSATIVPGEYWSVGCQCEFLI